MSNFGDDFDNLLGFVCEQSALGWESLCAQFGTHGAIGIVAAGMIAQAAIVVPAAARYFAPTQQNPTPIELSLSR
jgi:hypothetical protein